MPLASFLLLALILPGDLNRNQPAAGFNSGDAVQNTSSLGIDSRNVTSFQFTPPAPLAGSEDICYRIRAYMFRRDDDHAPEYVGSTTCGPRNAHTKKVQWPKAKLVPAN